jgi:3',5'-cyclic AMP phosphodiesterase CpdA
MWLIQLSDLHFTPFIRLSMPYEKLIKIMREVLLNFIPEKSSIVVCVCGDIVYKGDKRGYDLAERFFYELQHSFNFDFIFCFCPGNHDIIKNEDNFSSFNRFVFSVSNQNYTTMFSSEKSVISICVRDYQVVLVNSAYHRDIAYGLVNIEELHNELISSKSTNKIVVIHHHPIPVAKNDLSVIRNSYEFLTLCSEYNVLAILHGHRHMSNSLLMGSNNTAIIGVGSPFFLDTKNINNQFNIIQCDKGLIIQAISFRYIADKLQNGRLGSLQDIEIPFK